MIGTFGNKVMERWMAVKRNYILSFFFKYVKYTDDVPIY